MNVREFAAAARVSKQAVYQQLNKRLKGYVHEVEGMKMIEKSALSLFLLDYKDLRNADHKQEVEQEEVKRLKEEIDRLSELIRELEESKLIEQEKVNQLNLQLSEKDKKIIDLEKNEAVRLEKINQLEIRLEDKESYIKDYKQQLIEKDKQIADANTELKLQQQLSLYEKQRIQELEDKSNVIEVPEKKWWQIWKR